MAPPWQPGKGDRMCSDYFISDLPNSPNFVPSIQRKELERTGSGDSYRCFEHARSHARMKEQHSKELEENRWGVESEQTQLNGIQCAITHDHNYTSREGELLLLLFSEELIEELAMHEEQEPNNGNERERSWMVVRQFISEI